MIFFPLHTFMFKIGFKQGDKTHIVQRPGIANLSTHCPAITGLIHGTYSRAQKATTVSRVLHPLTHTSNSLKHQQSFINESAPLQRGDPNILLCQKGMKVLHIPASEEGRRSIPPMKHLVFLKKRQFAFSGIAVLKVNWPLVRRGH